MTTHIKELGDRTSKSVKPDFESEKYYHWQHMRRMAEQSGTIDKLPRKPRNGLAEESFFGEVDRRISRKSFVMGISFGPDGRVIRSK